jgi:hypothetical protein
VTGPVVSTTCLILMVLLGCTARPAPRGAVAPAAAAEALPLAPGEIVRLVTHAPSPTSFEATVDREGYIHLMLAQ